jgi:hypothetical protein
MARWALMKTRRLEIACERERMAESESHAIGFVSNMIVRSEAGVPPTHSDQHKA